MSMGPMHTREGENSQKRTAKKTEEDRISRHHQPPASQNERADSLICSTLSSILLSRRDMETLGYRAGQLLDNSVFQDAQIYSSIGTSTRMYKYCIEITTADGCLRFCANSSSFIPVRIVPRVTQYCPPPPPEPPSPPHRLVRHITCT
ncbi:unnamed protein product, partial [Ectocarpus fasciculatus]